MSAQVDNSNTTNRNDGYDRQDINVRFVAAVTCLVVVVIAVAVFVLYKYFLYQKERQVFEQTLRPQSEKLLELRARETELLTTYGVNDSVYGVLRIPIDSAIELMAVEADKIAAPAGRDR